MGILTWPFQYMTMLCYKIFHRSCTFAIHICFLVTKSDVPFSFHFSYASLCALTHLSATVNKPLIQESTVSQLLYKILTLYISPHLNCQYHSTVNESFHLKLPTFKSSSWMCSFYSVGQLINPTTDGLCNV